MTTLTKWEIYCNTDSKWVTGYLLKGLTPTACFENTNHEINLNSFQETEDIGKSTVIVQEEFISTGGYYKSICKRYVCPPGISTHDTSFPYPISALNIAFIPGADQIDDTFECLVGPNTIVGVITQNIATNTTVIPVSSTVLLYVSKGFYITIDDGVNTNNVGIVTNINVLSSEITVTIPTSVVFNANSLVKMTVKTIENFTIGYPGRYVIGDGKLGGAHVPANTIIRTVYTNIGGENVIFYPLIEYLY